MPVIRENLQEVFRHHTPKAEDLPKYEAINQAARDFAAAIIAHVPMCGDQQSALRHVRMARMEANAAITLDGTV